MILVKTQTFLKANSIFINATMLTKSWIFITIIYSCLPSQLLPSEFHFFTFIPINTIITIVILLLFSFSY